jgi:hypothetical protein
MEKDIEINAQIKLYKLKQMACKKLKIENKDYVRLYNNRGTEILDDSAVYVLEDHSFIFVLAQCTICIKYHIFNF